MNSFGYLFISKSLLASIRESRKQTREAVVEILKDCGLNLGKELYFLGSVGKEVFIFSDAIVFDTDGNLYEVVDAPGLERRLGILEDEDVELIIQKSDFMPRLEEIFKVSQENKKKKPKEEK
ncbi:MAG: hypothetical protein LiPW41_265 [Parcubacteria group bacterium LiPW_41]|nr:MAG: hypothetical protein LiPW41_265 [Parcubacteria group bacterium LiPW_41]